MQLEPTGERMIIDEYQSSPEEKLIYLMHIETYRFAEQFTRGKRVLDFGSGSGYGSAMLGKTAQQVIGVDVAADAVAYANEHFAHDRASFLQISADAALPFQTDSFDTVLSFQVFEHVEQEQRYLKEIYRVLTPGGTLVLVTPDRATRLFPMQQPWNRWHLREYSQRSLSHQIRKVFENVEILKMSGPPAILNIELRRCRRMKWLSLPFTLPFYPRAVRIGLLNIVHRFRTRHSSPDSTGRIDLDSSQIDIGKDLSPSVNLVAVARK